MTSSARSRRLAASWIAVLLLAVLAIDARADLPESARGSGAIQRGDPRVEASLLVDAARVRPGEPVRVGVRFELDPHWHIYWRNPGESGLATKLDWTGSDARVGPLRWPAPSVFREADGLITTYGYAESLLLVADATFSGAPGQAARLAVSADFLVCRVQCIPGSIALARDVPLAASSAPPDADTRARFARNARALPVAPDAAGLAAEALYSQSAIRPGDTFLAAVSLTCATPDAPDCAGLRPATADPTEAFVPDAVDGIEIRATGARVHPFTRGLLLTLSGRASADSADTPTRLRGVARVTDARGGMRNLEIDLPLPRTAQGAPVLPVDNPWLEPDPGLAGSAVAGVPLWQAFLLALLGGLILNLMPCVLPVLAIKVFGIAERAHAARAEVLAHGAAYTAGILATMAALAAVVVALRQAGTAVGWGFQFQEPLFVAAISTVLVVFALNLFGVFEVGIAADRLARTGEQATGLRRSFFEGLLAVVVATPCSAPFLGTAVGFAFASSAPLIFAIFLAIGLGLAAPFVLVTLVPGWARWIPRSGPWMVHLRAGLGFALLATVVWLLWIVSRATGPDGQALLLGFLVLVSLLTWGYGLLQRARVDGRAPLAALLLAAAAVAGLVALPLETRAPGASRQDSEGFARPYDPRAIAAELESGRAVFVYFTADWCLTCKVNERVVLRDARVAAEIQRTGVAAFVADWTLRDERIRAELARHGRAGVPMYLVYDPRRPAQPRVLPELLTVDLLLDALRAAVPESKTTETGSARPA